MIIFQGLTGSEELPKAACLTIGNFDGMHKGHQALIRLTVDHARKHSLLAGLMTFDPHPLKVLFPDKKFQTVFDLSDRVEVARGMGVDFVVIEPFTRALSRLEPESFFRNLLINRLHVKALFVGHDFNFGKDRSGTLEVLKKLCAKYGVELEVLPAVKIEGETVSSTRIRELVAAGEMEKVQKFLGRPFYLKGTIEKGASRGKGIGFPTANLGTRAEILPKLGVYVTYFEVEGRRHRAVTSVGKNPTFTDPEQSPVTVETYIMNFDRDIYGKAARVEFLHYLRPELKFDSVDALVKQIKKDVADAGRFNWPEN